MICSLFDSRRSDNDHFPIASEARVKEPLLADIDCKIFEVQWNISAKLISLMAYLIILCLNFRRVLTTIEEICDVDFILCDSVYDLVMSIY